MSCTADRKLSGIVAGLNYRPNGTPRPVSLSELGGLLVSQFDLPYNELCRSGKLFYAVHTVATAVAPLQVVPTTTAAFTLNNVSSSITAPKLVVPLFAGEFLASGTADIGTTLFAQVGSSPLATQLAADSTGVSRGHNFGVGSIAFVDLSQTVAGAWMPVGSVDNSAAAVPGTGVVVRLDGMFTVRPGYAFSLHALAGAGTNAKFVFSCLWAEVQGSTP